MIGTNLGDKESTEQNGKRETGVVYADHGASLAGKSNERLDSANYRALLIPIRLHGVWKWIGQTNRQKMSPIPESPNITRSAHVCFVESF